MLINGEQVKYVLSRQTTQIESLGSLPHEITQISRSDASGHNLITSDAARYFDYESAVALHNLAAAYGTDMPRYLLAPEVFVLLSKVTDLLKRLFIDALRNTGGRLNEILPLTKENIVLDDPLTGAPLSSPLVVLRALKQRKLEAEARRRREPCCSAIRRCTAAAGMVCDGTAGSRRAPVGHQK